MPIRHERVIYCNDNFITKYAQLLRSNWRFTDYQCVPYLHFLNSFSDKILAYKVRASLNYPRPTTIYEQQERLKVISQSN